MLSQRSVELVDAAWAQGLGCSVALVRTPGVHVVPGGLGLRGSGGVYLARIGDAVFVYCPEALRRAALEVIGGAEPDEVFSVRTLERIAGDRLEDVRGPAWHGFVDDACFVADRRPRGGRLSPDDDRLVELRRACGDGDWEEAGFPPDRGVAYGVEEDGRLVAAGNLAPFRGHLADVGLLTAPDHRGRGLARRLASRMIADALPDAGVVRFRARTTNAPSLAVARALGFVGRGGNLYGRLRPAAPVPAANG